MKLTTEIVTTFMEQKIPFNKYLGIKITVLRDGYAVMELPYQPQFIGDPFRPALHGGVISTLIDTCGGAAVFTKIEPQDRASTVDLRVDYLRPGPLDSLICEANILRIGNRVGVTEMKVYPKSDPTLIIASGKGVYNIRRIGQSLVDNICIKESGSPDRPI
ncbi:PaaI family thioesterase [candidate division CSSED10-310 bacterium]|uniref:Medium/long-chain acyl-CoA thioesterase YigI n=1 Tax=candidate division CSSED10-310 bacterium TaxID=2855610 RepID=A0ABV6YWS1_UNCC1